jgi:hypothetical protein
MGPIGAHCVDDPFAQFDGRDIAERVGGVPQLDDLVHPEDVRRPCELVSVRGHGRRLVGADRVPPVVGGPDHDHPPAGIGPRRDRPTDEQGHVVGVGDHHQHHAPLARLDRAHRRHHRPDRIPPPLLLDARMSR